MSTKEQILDNVKRQMTANKYDMPDIRLNAIQYANKIEQFVVISKLVGGDVRLLESGENVNDVIANLYPKAKKIASNLSEITLSTLNPDDVADPHELDGIDLAVIQAELGVAENACVWIPQNVKHKVVYFISEYLVILLDKDKIVNNMHEAYAQTQPSESGFGVFISGPSKTADIEQSLVVGAHGAKGVTIILR